MEKKKTERPAIALSPPAHAQVVNFCRERGLIIKAWCEKSLLEAVKREEKQ